jgi:hypothetical protein
MADIASAIFTDILGGAMAAFAIFLMTGTAAGVSLESKPMPTEAQVVIRSVRTAAKTKDFAALRKLMVPEFTWSFGGDGDADQAIAAWKRDPSAIRELYRVTGLRCAFNTDERNIQCPPNAGYRYRVGFTKTEQGWWMSYFVAGD